MRRRSPNDSTAAHSSALVRSRSPAGRRRQAGSTRKKVNFTTCRRAGPLCCSLAIIRGSAALRRCGLLQVETVAVQVGDAGEIVFAEGGGVGGGGELLELLRVVDVRQGGGDRRRGEG